jgi:hypothetical protein
MLKAAPKSGFAKIATLGASLYIRNQLLRDTDWASMADSLSPRAAGRCDVASCVGADLEQVADKPGEAMASSEPHRTAAARRSQSREDRVFHTGANLAAGRAAAPVATRAIVYCRRLSVGEAVGLPGGEGVSHVSCATEPSPNRCAGRPCRRPYQAV